MGAFSCGSYYFPDQAQFVPLASLADSGQAVVRIYAASLPGADGLAAHSWLVVKSAESRTFDRWEVWPRPAEPFGFVRYNLLKPEQDVGYGGTLILAELAGPEAEPVVDFIRTQSPHYPCKDVYVLLPGPNSSTYVQWVLDRTGWDVLLPPVVIGKYAPLNCPE